MNKTVVGIDVGTTKVCALVGEMTDAGTLRIVGVGIAPAKGMQRGVVINVREATECITTAVERAERISGYEIEGAYVSVGGEHIASTNNRAVIAISRGENGVLPEDTERVIDAARAIAIPHTREIVHAVPRGYTVDGQSGVREPIGMQGTRLEVEAHIITGAVTSIQNLIKAVRGAGVTVNELVVPSIASGEAALTNAEREMGVVLADIGGGTTDIAIFIDGSVWHTAVLGIGGNHLTNDIAFGLRTPVATAEEIKRRYGHALPAVVPENETLEVAVFGADERQLAYRRDLAEIIEPRAEEIFSMILQEIKRSGYDGLLPAGIVLCGGVARLAGFGELGREVLQLPVRVGSPRNIEGLVENISDAAYTGAVGLLWWGLRHTEKVERKSRRPRHDAAGVWGQVRQWLRVFLPG